MMRIKVPLCRHELDCALLRVLLCDSDFDLYLVTIPHVNVSLNALRLSQDSSTRPKFKVAFLKWIVSLVLIVHTKF
jgi:hypothetical protein